MLPSSIAKNQPFAPDCHHPNYPDWRFYKNQCLPLQIKRMKSFIEEKYYADLRTPINANETLTYYEYITSLSNLDKLDEKPFDYSCAFFALCIDPDLSMEHKGHTINLLLEFMSEPFKEQLHSTLAFLPPVMKASILVYVNEEILSKVVKLMDKHAFFDLITGAFECDLTLKALERFWERVKLHFLFNTYDNTDFATYIMELDNKPSICSQIFTLAPHLSDGNILLAKIPRASKLPLGTEKV